MKGDRERDGGSSAKITSDSIETLTRD